MFLKKKAFTILCILYLVFPVAMAQTVSFAEPDTLTHKDVYLFNASGTQLGLYNTTSTGINITGTGDVFFVIKPQYSTPLDSPGTWLTSLFAYVQTNSIALLFALFLIGFFFKKW